MSSRVGGRVARLVDVRRLEISEQAVPEAGPGEALVRLSASGICGTDLHAWNGRFMTFPITLGHDAGGVVEALGPDTPGPAVGSRVVIDPQLSCGECLHCRGGRRHLCAQGSYLGIDATGTLAEHIVVPAHRLVDVPDAVDDEAATVVEPVAVALHLLQRVGPTVEGRPAEVVGGGPLGILLAQTLAAHGHAVRVHEVREDRRRITAAAGLETVDATAAAVPLDEPALVVETSASASGAARAWDLASPGSSVAVVGRAPWEAPFADVLLRELSVFGVRSGGDRYPAALDLVARGLVRPSDVVTHRFALEDVGAAFEACADPAAAVMRAVVRT